MPLVASTGGLVDTVKEGVTGFQMGAMDPDSLSQADAGEPAMGGQIASALLGLTAGASIHLAFKAHACDEMRGSGPAKPASA